MLTDGTGSGAAPHRRGRRVQQVHASVFPRTESRHRIWFTGRCHCGTYVFGTVPSVQAMPYRKRLTCGHAAIIIAARVYKAPAMEADAE